MIGIEAQAQSIGAMAANSVASAVWFEDETNMADALRGALVNPGVVYVDVSDGEGTVWASVGHDPDPDQSLEQATETFATSTPVVFSGERIRASRKPSEPHGKGGRGKFIRFAGNPSDHRQLIAPPKEQGK